ncbi:uncharacterized protein LOC131800850 [Musca domestica]|uniref:Uncharacterized protein LOC131800850 n=1 Tax=Musca domestica TaxID=7370 RepID=A0ABM3UM92_MUSDO|nr:uncharacterized protein LOC131800850 [Musca domestica]
MKFTISFLLTPLVCALACNPYGDNKATCNAGNLMAPIRNFDDPTRYWMCRGANVEPETVRCPDTELFDSSKGACVPWNEWVWSPPCPEI